MGKGIMVLILAVLSLIPIPLQAQEYNWPWHWNGGTIVTEIPERPVGQKSVLGLALPKMECVRVGFVAQML